MSGQRIVVIGAGIAGLVAARRLSRAGHSVRVLEAGEMPGGRVGDRQVRGIRFNAGARLLYDFSRPFNSLLDELGLTAALVPVRHLSAQCVGTDGRWTVELMPGVKSLFTPGLSLMERLRFLSFARKQRAARSHTDPDDAASALAEDDITLADYISRELGPRVLERMIEPVFRGTRSWNAEDVSAAFFASVTPHLIGRDTVHVLAGGMGKLPAALASGLMVDCATRVVGVETPATGPCRIHAEHDGKPVQHEADLVVCATEGSRAARLFPQLREEDRGFLSSVRYNALGIVHYQLGRQVAPAMKFFTRDASGPLATWQQVPGNDATGQAPQLYAQLSPEAVREALRRDMTDSLDLFVRPQVLTLCPTLERDCVDMHNQWIAHKLPVFYPGYARAVARFRDRQSEVRRRVYFCGDYLAQSLVTGAAASGERAAADIARHWA
ncbi:protoporphyrinogen/coproporphyrinogen oxidase [Chelatococcus asaccharovorans]|uniref:Oxygen-dependent protoporphyrinogen oxidase n=1 Tax=Chelatococcus asaccharovorans TaxID=28210 RepID=A0A2V3UAR1_9HYPH|nr:FAD-dependent oxidoreductase [Chelatococcus asaccharovorans]MBS7707681.1 FAD-dependent oxidoreductase [Chelatococcus asaccharovorans]PXW55257.1 oxygen-dependent protoporphyrinogen oxidase [Chelatococcus asaccharovorans]